MFFKKKKNEDINDPQIFSEMVLKSICNGDDMKTVYEIFESKGPFEPKRMISRPSEDVINACAKMVSHKMAVADKLYADCKELLHIEDLYPGDELSFATIEKCIRELDATDMMWDDVFKEEMLMADIDQTEIKAMSLEQKYIVLEMDLGSFEASCDTAADKIRDIANQMGLEIVP